MEDETDAEAVKQRAVAKRLIESGKALMVSKTVILELEWVMRGYYGFTPAEIAPVFAHLLTFAHITIEGRTAVEQALASFEQGLDFADSLHHASYQACNTMATFDDRKFSRRAVRLGLVPRVIVPK